MLSLNIRTISTGRHCLLLKLEADGLFLIYCFHIHIWTELNYQNENCELRLDTNIH
jgi:hypothetical protein